MNRALLQQIDAEYKLDIQEYRARFARVQKNDESLATWFRTFPFLTTHDMTQIAQVSPKTVYRWRRRAGIAPRKIKPVIFNRRRRKLVAPAGWDTDWLIDCYESGYSIPQLADATGRSWMTIHERLRRRITLRSKQDSVRTLNPCCTRKWIEEHYVNRGLSQQRCASIARVSKYTFASWLDRFGIRARSISEQSTCQQSG